MDRHPLQNHKPKVLRRNHKWVMLIESVRCSRQKPIGMSTIDQVGLLGLRENTSIINQQISLFDELITWKLFNHIIADFETLCHHETQYFDIFVFWSLFVKFDALLNLRHARFCLLVLFR